MVPYQQIKYHIVHVYELTAYYLLHYKNRSKYTYMQRMYTVLTYLYTELYVLHALMHKYQQIDEYKLTICVHKVKLVSQAMTVIRLSFLLFCEQEDALWSSVPSSLLEQVACRTFWYHLSELPPDHQG